MLSVACAAASSLQALAAWHCMDFCGAWEGLGTDALCSSLLNHYVQQAQQSCTALQISERMWTLWPRICEAFNTWAIDYFDNILVPLDNFISRDTDRFLAGQSPNYLQQVGYAEGILVRQCCDSSTSILPKAPGAPPGR